VTDLTITVRRQWNNRRAAVYRFGDVSELHWSSVSGGLQKRANRYYIHGYVMCDAMLSGQVAHSCKHGEGPHRIKICIIKKLNLKIWQKLLEAVGVPDPNRPGKLRWRKRRDLWASPGSPS
jgi:hypothetical protein